MKSKIQNVNKNAGRSLKKNKKQHNCVNNSGNEFFFLFFLRTEGVFQFVLIQFSHANGLQSFILPTKRSPHTLRMGKKMLIPCSVGGNG